MTIRHIQGLRVHRGPRVAATAWHHAAIALTACLLAFAAIGAVLS